jgi:hypothetical protein
VNASAEASVLTSSVRIPLYAYSMPFVEHYAQINTQQWVAALYLQLFINKGEKHGKNGFR